MHPAAKAEAAKKAQLAERLQELCRSLQAQNRAAREEDAAKRKQLLDSFQASIEDIKSKCAGAAPACLALIPWNCTRGSSASPAGTHAPAARQKQSPRDNSENDTKTQTRSATPCD
jgi:hypothetical protein